MIKIFYFRLTQAISTFIPTNLNKNLDMANTSAKALFNPKTMVVTALSVAFGLLIFHMAKKHILSQMGA